MGSQRFCLRWNNHQSNLLSVFDQLLHEEAFVDVTLAVEGQYLRAHKMVLSACSPYFQTLFVGHPDKHPIVILKDVPYSDMRSLLDFMYRGEVSVDQDRLTAFLKVAESLKIKGLTEVNEERCDLPSIANSLLGGSIPPVPHQPSPVPSHHHHTPPPPPAVPLPPPVQSTPAPPPNLHRIHLPQKRPSSAVYNSSTLTIPRRKRGRPRKLESAHTPSSQHLDMHRDNKLNNVEHNHINEGVAGGPVVGGVAGSAGLPVSGVDELTSSSAVIEKGDSNNSTVGSPKKEEKSDEEIGIVHSGVDASSPPNPPIAGSTTMGTVDVKHEPTPSTSTTQEGCQSMCPAYSKLSSAGNTPCAVTPTATSEPNDCFMSSRPDGKGVVQVLGEDGVTDMDAESDSDSLVVATAGDTDNNNGEESKERPVVKRRVRRRATSSTDPAEALTEMSVRGLNLFRYASIAEGLYKCMECAKSDVSKTFKNKYSFQRHAFLYHEGHQRKVFPCPVCAKEFSRPDKMKNHMKTVHDCFMPKECLFPAVGFYMPPPLDTPPHLPSIDTPPPSTHHHHHHSHHHVAQTLLDQPAPPPPPQSATPH